MMPLRVDAPLRYFAGHWALSRRIVDRRAGIIGRLSGTAWLEPDQNGLAYEERGVMTYGAHHGPAGQSYRWEILADDQLEIRFRDGRLFHRLDLRQGMAVVEHQCAADHYRGRYQVIAENRWASRWQVSGPRKDLTIINLFRRHTPAASGTTGETV